MLAGCSGGHTSSSHEHAHAGDAATPGDGSDAASPGTHGDGDGDGHGDGDGDRPGHGGDASLPDEPDGAVTGPQLCDDANAQRPDGLPDWSHAGFRAGEALPSDDQIALRLAAADFGVVADDGKDDSAALQAAIDHVGTLNGRDFSHYVLLSLPGGRIDISCEIHVDQSFLILRGQGSDATHIVVRPGENMRWDVLSADGSAPGLDDITQGSAKGGWLWPGRGAFRVQTRAVHPAYASEYAAAPANRKDLFEGTVNAHWKAGLSVSQAAPVAARAGERVLPLEKITGLAQGQSLWVGAANSKNFYDSTGVTNVDYQLNGHMRAQVFTIESVDTAKKTVTLDKPLEFDVTANNTADGSEAIDGSDYLSKVVPLTLVQGVGFEDFALSYELDGLPKLAGGTYALTREQALDEYGNLAPEYALHGIIFKWASDSWVRRVRIEMCGSHPIVTEVARHLQIEDNHLIGSWNKGKGGNGYLRGSRVWDSLYRGNVLRELRHFTFQWSASGNVATGNDLDCDFNFHGGWERFNLVENNIMRVSYGHRPGSCTVNCGEEGGGGSDTGNWYPVWWGAGAKSGKWSGASGPRNVLYGNRMTKQTEAGGEFLPYLPYDDGSDACPRPVVQLGWSRSASGGYQPLATQDGPILDWAMHETVDFSAAPNLGVDAHESFAGSSLWRKP